MKQRARMSIGTSVSVVLLALLVGTASVAVASEGDQTLDQLLAQKTIRIRDVKKLPLPVRTSDGPVLRVILDQNKVAWFWFIPGPAVAAGTGRIRLIAIGEMNDENHATIVWPQNKVGHDYGTELRAIYK